MQEMMEGLRDISEIVNVDPSREIVLMLTSGGSICGHTNGIIDENDGEFQSLYLQTETLGIDVHVEYIVLWAYTDEIF